MSRIAKICAMIGGLSIGLAACTTLHVTTDVNPNLSVAVCHSYTFAPVKIGGSEAAFSNPLNADRVRSAIEANMASRGVTHAADPASADCMVGYGLGTRQVFNDYYAGWGMGWGYGWGYGWRGPGWGGYWGYDGPWVENETRVALDVFDNHSKKPMWHGAVSQTVSDLSGPNADAKIRAAVAAIFTKLPIGTAPAGTAPPPAAAAPAAPEEGSGFFMYPKNGQSEAQQAKDRSECEQWANQQSHGSTTSVDFKRAMIACIEGRGYSVN
jgi:hypothetical protein